jgi:hypothetical protein
MGSVGSSDAEHEFHERLREVVTDAAEDGVDVEGSWPVRNDDSAEPDWDIEIIRLAESNQ